MWPLFTKMRSRDKSNPRGLRVVTTARTEKAINKAASEGFWPLVKKLEPSKEINSKFCVWQNRKSGEIEVCGDYRSLPRGDGGDWERVIGWTEYYPHHFSSPFAAYMIPKDIQLGERVFVKDLIEDFISASWNQGDVYRLDACEAIWNGKDLDIQYDPEMHRSDFIG